MTESGKVEVNGRLTANTISGKGGKIHVLGKEVEVLGTAIIDASGAVGDGEVLFGGSFQGQDRSIPHSERTVVHSGAQISVDSFECGNGGRAIVWSDANTYFYGHVNARGGEEGGDGGFIEVSGQDQLAFNGTVMTIAPKGKPGELLLDPRTVVLVGGSEPPLTSNLIFFGTPPVDSTLTIGIDSVISALGSGNVVIEASSDIFVVGSNLIQPTAANILRLRAGNSIQFVPTAHLNLGQASFEAFINSKGAVAGQIHSGVCVFQMLEDSSLKKTTGDILIGLPKGLLRVPALGSVIKCAPGQCKCVSLNNCPADMCCPDSITTDSGSKIVVSIPPNVQLNSGLLGGAGANLQQSTKP